MQEVGMNATQTLYAGVVAAGVAALLAGKVTGVEGATVAVVVSGGNVAGEIASGILKPDPR